MKTNWIVAIVITGGITTLITLSCVASAITNRANEKERQARAVVIAKKKAEAEAAWKAITPEQHIEAARVAVGRRDLALARKHASALPEDKAAPIQALISKTNATIKAEAKAKAIADAKAREAMPGERPDTSTLTYALESALKKTAHDPDSVSDVTVYDPEPAKVGKIGCWKVGFMFRARNGFGALRKTYGTVWYKDGMVIKQAMD